MNRLLHILFLGFITLAAVTSTAHSETLAEYDGDNGEQPSQPPTTSPLIELARPGITLSDSKIGGASYTTLGDEWVQRESGVATRGPWSVTRYFSPRGVEIVSKTDPSPKLSYTRVFYGQQVWSIRRPVTDVSKLPPDYCALTSVDEETWKIRPTQVSCADATSVLRGFLRTERSPSSVWRCVQSEEAAKCWKRSKRTQYALAVETGEIELSRQRDNRKNEVAHCGIAQAIGYISTVIARIGDQSSCVAFAAVAPRVLAHKAIYGTAPTSDSGWNCVGVKTGLRCTTGAKCVILSGPGVNNADIRVGVDPRGGFWHTNTRNQCSG